MVNNFKNFLEIFKNLSIESLNNLKTMFFILIVGDLFGVYYFLEWKKLGMALLLVIVFFLAIVLFYLKDKQPNEISKPKEENDKINLNNFNIDLSGL